MPIESLARLVDMAQTAPLALLAAVALFAAYYQTVRLSRVQDRLLELACAATAGRGDRPPNIGTLAAALTTADDVDVRCAALAQQQAPGQLIGQLLVRQGAVTGRQLKRLLKVQRRIKSHQRPTLAETEALADYATRQINKRRQ